MDATVGEGRDEAAHIGGRRDLIAGRNHPGREWFDSRDSQAEEVAMALGGATERGKSLGVGGAVAHPQWFEDVICQVVAVRLPRYGLDDDAQEDVVEVGVLVRAR